MAVFVLLVPVFVLLVAYDRPAYELPVGLAHSMSSPQNGQNRTWVTPSLLQVSVKTAPQDEQTTSSSSMVFAGMSCAMAYLKTSSTRGAPNHMTVEAVAQ